MISINHETWRGSRVVHTGNNSGDGYGKDNFYSVLFVNNGDTATTTRAYHKTLTGAINWANKILAKGKQQ